ncbi:MAG TPA: zinc-binding dehydrogenase [Kiritimatiellia bacterium]|nr:zinc-binding dehydrogenase [Kiritimatiellia bacterium]HSA17449.1 zinc-binding dehydrogenase [Kiritimatiellia bacterium]
MTLGPFEPTPPAGWVRLRSRLCGICGSDLRLLRGEESFLMEPFASFPFVPGHEIAAEILDAPAGTGWKTGERVTVEPVLCCETRGLPPCPSCARGNYHVCENFTRGALAPGISLGYTAGPGGGMAEEFFAHPRQLVRLPEAMDDRLAVLTDSLACALQAALPCFPADGQTVVVYGAGILGQHVVRLLRALGSKARVIAVVRHEFQRGAALAGGATEAMLSPSRQELAERLGGRFLPTTLGGGTVEGAADVFFDCVGSARSLQEGLLQLKARGRLALIASSSRVGLVDVSPLWFRELAVTGSALCGLTKFRGETRRTYERAMDLLAGRPDLWRDLVTHVFPLRDHARAFQAAFDKRRFHSMKVALDPRA